MPASSSSNGAPVQAIRAGLVALLLAMPGCAQTDADIPGTWRPSGVNDQNLRAMLANPADAYGGVGATTSRGDSGGRAVTRLLTDRRRQLLDVTSSRIGGSSASPAESGGSANGAP